MTWRTYRREAGKFGVRGLAAPTRIALLERQGRGRLARYRLSQLPAQILEDLLVALLDLE
jgi:hypothetical protein